VCRVAISDLEKLASELAKEVADRSWMSRLDAGSKRAYNKTVEETARILKGIFDTVGASSEIAGDFGEIMVSMGSARALKMVFGHAVVPLAELWKPQIKQNGGFDFHTVCDAYRINFGEAKYSSTSNPHGEAFDQASEFLTAEKHLRDRPDLEKLVDSKAISNLDADDFGVVAAFSLNSTNHELVLRNAVKSAEALAKKHDLKSVYIVGVARDS
jgi:hypothetical protein